MDPTTRDAMGKKDARSNSKRSQLALGKKERERVVKTTVLLGSTRKDRTERLSPPAMKNATATQLVLRQRLSQRCTRREVNNVDDNGRQFGKRALYTSTYIEVVVGEEKWAFYAAFFFLSEDSYGRRRRRRRRKGPNQDQCLLEKEDEEEGKGDFFGGQKMCVFAAGRAGREKIHATP